MFEAEIFPLGAIKLCLKPVRTSPWGTKTVLLRCSGFFFVNLEHVYSWLAVSTGDNDQVKAPGKDINIIYNI